MTLKLLKKLLILILGILVIFSLITLFVIKEIQVEVTNADLPQDIYEENGDLLAIAKAKLIGFAVFHMNDDDYTGIEEFLNFYILYEIHQELNSDYNPFAETQTDETRYIYTYNSFYIDYLYASVTENNQIELTISIGSSSFKMFDSALHLYFDIDVSVQNMSLTLTLTDVFLDTIKIDQSLLDQIFSSLNKEAIEESITTGTLDLTTYTYTVGLINP